MTNEKNIKFSNIVNIKHLHITEDYYNQFIDLNSIINNIDKTIFTFEKFVFFIKNLPKNHKIYVYIKNNIIIASCSLIIEEKIIYNGNKIANVHDLIVEMSERKNNIQSIFIEYLIDLSYKKKYYKLNLYPPIYLENYYNKFGFIKKGLYMVHELNI